MPARSRLGVLVLGLGVVGAPSLTAQAPQFAKAGARYSVQGEFQGEFMSPWEAEIRIRDTTLDVGKAIVIACRGVRAGMDAVSETFAFVDPASGKVLRVSGDHRGHVSSNYQLTLKSGRVAGKSVTENAGSEQIDEELSSDAIPDFALGPLIAAQELKEGATFSATVFRFNGTLFRYTLAAKVSSGTYTRAGAPKTEAVWIVEGDGAFSARIVVAKSDRTVLEYRLPMGTVGSQTETFAGPLR